LLPALAGCLALSASAWAQSPGALEGQRTSLYSLEIGHCFSGIATGADGNGEVVVVDCARPHVFEVFHVFNLAGEAYPGQAQVEARANLECARAFQGYVGVSYIDSRLAMVYLTPDAESWALDREVVCLLQSQNMSPRTGSARNLRI
jgi:hypothetical protein